MSRLKASYLTSVTVAVVFIASLWLPTVDNFFNIAPNVTKNKESAFSRLPELKADRKSIIQFHKMYVKLFIDDFGFRNTLIRWNSLFRMNCLRVAQFPKVLVGRDDWLYLIKDDDGNNALDYYRAVRPFATEKDVAEWARPLYDIKKECDRRGARFLLVIAPMKPSIYPEYLPSNYEPVRETGRLEQLTSYLKKTGGIDFIDLTAAVAEGKKEHRVFFKHDVHWSSYGAYYGYREMAAALVRFCPGLLARRLAEFNVRTVLWPGGDLASMLGLKEQFVEEFYLLEPKDGWKAKKIVPPYQIKSSRLTEFFSSFDQSQPRAVVFHDSFFNMQKYYMAEHFSRMVCLQSYNRVQYSVIETEKPNIVIYEMAESFLQKSPVYVTPLK
ncbi:MAG: hypothetical protein JW807_03595 [Spirochaetes bacterium]|nr:hypothetical protein [Spirochaetota bacterium]